MQRARNVNNRAAQPPHAVGGVWAFNLIAQERVIGSIGLRASRHLIGGAFTSLTGPGHSAQLLGLFYSFRGFKPWATIKLGTLPSACLVRAPTVYKRRPEGRDRHGRGDVARRVSGYAWLTVEPDRPKCSPDLTSLTRWLACVYKSVDPAAGLP